MKKMMMLCFFMMLLLLSNAVQADDTDSSDAMPLTVEAAKTGISDSTREQIMRDTRRDYDLRLKSLEDKVKRLEENDRYQADKIRVLERRLNDVRMRHIG